MHGHFTYDYATIRVVPKVEREEFVNVGVIVSCPARGFLEACIELDEQRLMALDSTLDVKAIRDYLAIIPTICTGGDQAGPIGQLLQRERFYWLVAPRSTIIQTSSVHTGFCKNPAAVLERLLNAMVRPCTKPPAGAAELVGTFEDTGWAEEGGNVLDLWSGS
ncbi:MAG TPA: DUF3037 domain-containing protein [Candidatus Caenarcaniphilales bacterium]